MLIRITNLLVGIGIFKDLGKGVFALSNLASAFVMGSTNPRQQQD